MKTHPIRIVGFDPGLRRTGWGAIDVISNRLIFVGSGLITSDGKLDLASRLLQLHNGVMEVLEHHDPNEVAVEQTFVNKDAAATLKLGQARAIALLAPAQRGLEVAEYAPNAVKKTVVGVGHADKNQVQTMVKMLLPKAQFDSEDAADALAIAICHAHQRGQKAYKIA
ncbi:crossover junction endodeoxyribonuclease RuvC [uncultured Cohaesibacter sp.]|uniref:crossover junction endodeoxyribonuclease RuvC n=1 Tax=uncultured Cohaesibacter sp. TaxID=1002546 RepID=UPI0029C959DF|nr:crossover junction endodeoxyribonuclease RuvC [uncultured Cohaesibacter sp.]